MEYDRNKLYAFTKLTKLTCRGGAGQPLPDPLPPTSVVRNGEKQPDMVTGSSEFKLDSLIPGAALHFPACLQRTQAGKAFPKVNTDWPVASYFILPPHHHNNQYPQLESPREDCLPSPCFDRVCSWGHMLRASCISLEDFWVSRGRRVVSRDLLSHQSSPGFRLSRMRSIREISCVLHSCDASELSEVSHACCCPGREHTPVTTKEIAGTVQD